MQQQPAFLSDKVYQTYYDEVGKHPLLSAKEERKLLIRYHTCPHCERELPQKVAALTCPKCGEVAPADSGERAHTCTSCLAQFEKTAPPLICPRCGSERDLRARECLINANLRFVIRRAKSITQDPEHLQKLISAGNVGLVIALDKFSLERNTRFLTYAEWWIRKEIMDEIHASHLIHIPTHKQKTIQRAQKEGKYVCMHCDARTHDPSNAEHAPPCTKDEHSFRVPISKGAPIVGPTVDMEDLHLTSSTDIESQSIDSSMENLLRGILLGMGLTQRDLYILMGYFNVPVADRKGEAKTLPQLAAMTSITPERVRQVKEQLLRELRRELRRRSIPSYDAICCT